MTSVEFFHLYYRHFDVGKEEHVSRLLGELEKAQGIAMAFPNDWVRMVMIDDQPVPKRDRAVFFAPIIAQLHRIGVDYIAFELDMNKLKDEWLETQSNSDDLRKSIKKVYNGNLSCSHYIAIWYSLRLGLLEDRGCFVPISTRAMYGLVSPVASTLKNFLPKEFQQVEEETQNVILANSRFANAFTDCVERYYHG